MRKTKKKIKNKKYGKRSPRKPRILVPVSSYATMIMEENRAEFIGDNADKWLEFLVPPRIHEWNMCFYLEQRGVNYILDYRGKGINIYHGAPQMPAENKILPYRKKTDA